jgi:hypothetical protein
MKMRNVLVVAALAAIATTLSASAAPAGVRPAAAAKCTNGVSDRIKGKTVCIHVGGKCLAAHNAKYRAKGYTCVSGRLRRSTKPAPSPQPTPPPPPPAPPALPGHYEGRTSQNEIIMLDVRPDGASLTGLNIHTVNRSCNPGQGWWGPFGVTGVIPIASGGTWTLELPYTFGFSDGTTGTGHMSMKGAFSGTTLTGDFTDTSSFTYQGTPFSCSTKVVTFTASRQ